MKTLLIITLVFLFGSMNAQVTDTDIVESLIGEKYYQIVPKLDSLGVWYHTHVPEKLKSTTKIYSIADGDGTVKLFVFKLYDRAIEDIIINYRHDSMEQINDMNKLTKQTGHHVGKYSTDMVFNNKKFSKNK